MSVTTRIGGRLAAFGIAALCFGYFASYVPYSMTTKLLTSGMLDGMSGQKISGFVIQPVIITFTVICMYAFLTLAGWFKYATQWKLGRLSLPRPRWFTFLAGVCTAGIIVTTTLAYTFQGISIVFAMLLMRGGVLVLAPVVDLIAVKRKRKIYWPSWVAAGLSFASLFVTFSGKAGTAMTVVATVDITLYLLSYFIRLYFMSSWAKSRDVVEMKRFFTEDQMTANAVLFVVMCAAVLVGSTMPPESILGQLWLGVVDFPFRGLNGAAALIAVGSFGAGLFGSLIFLDRRENTFTVPANRVSSVIAGVVATYLMAGFYGGKPPPATELVSVGMIIVAIIFLAYRARVERRQRAEAALPKDCEPEEAVLAIPVVAPSAG